MSRRIPFRWFACIPVAAAASAPSLAAAQSRPFPQASGYAQGFTATNISSADAQAIYQTWKKEYLKSDCGGGMLRVEFDNPHGSTVSEGMGYGMVLTAYHGDKSEFDGLWKFVQKNLNSNHLMGWHATCSGFTTSDGGSGSATDGDTDIAFALVVAVDQWGDAYKKPALDLLASLKAKDFTKCAATGRVMATNGDWDSGCDSVNSSYFMPAYYRVFAAFTGDSFWAKAADDALAIWNANHDATTGLVANEVNQNGGTSGASEVDYNGCRIPWRSVLDYLWYGTPAAKTFTDRITDWVDSKGPSNLVDGYATDGTPKGSWNGSSCFNGGYATGAMSKSADRVTRFSDYFRSLKTDNYYETSLRSLYMLLLSGNMWKPGSPVAPDAGASDGGPSVDAATPDAHADTGTTDADAVDDAADGAADGGAGAVTQSDGGPSEDASGGCGVGRSHSGGAVAFGILAMMLAKRRAALR